MANFIHTTGTNGFTTSPFSLATTELNSLGSGNTALTSVNGTSGKFNQTSFGSAQYGYVWFTAGGAMAGTPTAGANICGWWLLSTDGGSTFEITHSNASLPRPPDFIIPIYSGGAIAASDIYTSPLVPLPYTTCKVFIQNNCGQALNASGNIITCGPVEDTYA